MGLFGPPNIEKLKAKKDIPALSKALEYEKDWKVRVSAAEALGQIGDSRAVEPLITALKVKDADLHQAAAEALAVIGAPAVDPLMTVLFGLDHQMKIAAVVILGKIKDPRAIQLLINILGKSYKKDNQLSKAASQALINIGSPAIKHLVSALGTKGNWNLVESAEFTLVGMGKLSVKALIIALHDSEVSWYAAKALGKIGDDKAVEPLIAILNEDDPFRTAIEALGDIGDLRAVEPLMALLNVDNEDISTAAIRALGKIGDERTVEPLLAFLTGDQAEKSIAAAKALGNMRESRAVEPLLALLTGGPWSARRDYAEALGEFGDPRAVKPLLELLDASDLKMRKTAANALIRLYQSGQLDHKHQQMILANRPMITRTHVDKKTYERSGYGSSDCHEDHGKHEDNRGLGISFPV
jgi:HEAT repeat protein